MRPVLKSRTLALSSLAALVVLTFPLGARAQSGTAQGVISGRVVNSAGEPLAESMIFSAPVGAGVQGEQAKTDRNGDFKLSNLGTGLYRVWVNAPGYVSPFLSTVGDTSYYRPGDSVTFTMIKGGVITGTVSGPNGRAIAAPVRAIRLRDETGKLLPSPTFMRERLTDDRGIYRLYSLAPGTYLVSAGGPYRFGGYPLPALALYDGDGPTYFPSSTRDTASEVTVRSGEEVTADIQYRGEPAHSVSGTVAGVPASQSQISYSASITLADVRDKSQIGMGTASSSSDFAFSISGVPDGEYEISASQLSPGRETLRSEPRRIKVRGADITGVKLTLAPMATIEGRLVLESDPKAGCARRRESATQETLILGRRYEAESKSGDAARKPPAVDAPLVSRNLVAEAVPDTKGSFTLRNLVAGSFRIDPRPPASGWYVRSIGMGSAQSVAQAKLNSILARDGLNVKSGERVSGLTITMTEGAASLRGRVEAAEGQRLPARMRVYVVPAEKESADNVLRFFEAEVELDGGFAIGNIAPGQYSIVARENDQRDTTISKRIREDASRRAELLREAEKLKLRIELKPCQRLIDFNFFYQSRPHATDARLRALTSNS